MYHWQLKSCHKSIHPLEGQEDFRIFSQEYLSCIPGCDSQVHPLEGREGSRIWTSGSATLHPRWKKSCQGNPECWKYFRNPARLLLETDGAFHLRPVVARSLSCKIHFTIFVYVGVGVFDMPNSYRYNILSILIFCKIPLLIFNLSIYQLSICLINISNTPSPHPLLVQTSVVIGILLLLVLFRWTKAFTIFHMEGK